MSDIIDKTKLEKLYTHYNRREYVHPDPLEFLYRYDDILDREIAAMIASSLAYGKVAQILKSVSLILDEFPNPHANIQASSMKSLQKTFKGFKHRFTTGDDIAALLNGIRCTVEEHGSLVNCFLDGFSKSDETILPALTKFAATLTANTCEGKTYLLPCPSDGSACKRLNLFLRWMVRRDDVDPGGWYNVPSSKLIVPLDTHMHRICLAMGLTERKQPDLRTACEITSAFRRIAPDDPVKYDFCLTRLGIRKGLDSSDFLWENGGPEVKRHA